MAVTKKTYFNWSTGKDAALAFYYLNQNENHNIDKLFTTINGHHDRVSMHGLRFQLLDLQVKSIGLPLSVLKLPEEPSMEVYNTLMDDKLNRFKNEGYHHCGFGDIFLEDLRKYREQQMDKFGVKCVFPLWKRDTKEIMRDFIGLGFKAIVIAVKSEFLDESFVGREINQVFLDELPSNVDPCGENGEFHTFCYDGPIFKYGINFKKGEKVFRSYKSPKGQDNDVKKDMGFWFIDLIPDK